MEKVKVTEEQVEALNAIKTEYSDKNHAIYFRATNFKTPKYQCLNDLTIENFCRALIIGYELELPPTPKLETKKIDVSFNNENVEGLPKNEEIYIGINNSVGQLQFCQGFSIGEAKEIADTLYLLINYYEKYCKQNDSQIVNKGE